MAVQPSVPTVQEKKDWLATRAPDKQLREVPADTFQKVEPKMLALPILILAFPFLVAGQVVAVSLAVIAALFLLSPFAAVLLGYAWIGAHVLNFIQSLFG